MTGRHLQNKTDFWAAFWASVGMLVCLSFFSSPLRADACTSTEKPPAQQANSVKTKISFSENKDGPGSNRQPRSLPVKELVAKTP
jgi:hypothetical protein